MNLTEAKAWLGPLLIEDDDGAPLPEEFQPAFMLQAVEALAKINNPIIIQQPRAASHSCVGCDTKRRWAMGEEGQHAPDCVWVRARQIVNGETE